MLEYDSEFERPCSQDVTMTSQFFAVASQASVGEEASRVKNFLQGPFGVMQIIFG
jgi:hypothetical protein